MAESGPRAKKKVVEKVSFRDERERERERERAAAASGRRQQQLFLSVLAPSIEI